MIELAPVRAVLSTSSALRRARRMKRVLEGARLLWVDDQPALSGAEQRSLELLGTEVVRALDTGRAIELLAASPTRRGTRAASFDLIISDIARPGAPRAGLEAMSMIRAVAPDVSVIFYVGKLDRDAGVPAGAFGITNDPDELLHLVLDVLERRRT